MRMANERSYFSRPYAPAWGILIGTEVGVLIDLATQGSGTVTGTVALLGLIIGTVIYYEGKSSAKDKLASGSDASQSRLRKLERLRSKSLISDDEYELKRKEIHSDL